MQLGREWSSAPKFPSCYAPATCYACYLFLGRVVLEKKKEKGEEEEGEEEEEKEEEEDKIPRGASADMVPSNPRS